MPPKKNPKKGNVTGHDVSVVKSLSDNDGDENHENDDTASDEPAMTTETKQVQKFAAGWMVLRELCLLWSMPQMVQGETKNDYFLCEKAKELGLTGEFNISKNNL